MLQWQLLKPDGFPNMLVSKLTKKETALLLLTYNFKNTLSNGWKVITLNIVPLYTFSYNPCRIHIFLNIHNKLVAISKYGDIDISQQAVEKMLKGEPVK